MGKKTPILVTGSHRSGSTWTGLMLAAAPGVGYIHEPFNKEIRINVNSKPFEHQFQYLCEKNAENYKEVLHRIIQYKYPLAGNITRITTLKDFTNIIRDQGIFLKHRLKNLRPLIKDPHALFSAEWLYETFNMDVLVLIRHPAAFCSSLKIKKWYFGFNNFLTQPLLMKEYLAGFEEEIREQVKTQKNIIDQAILLWNCIHHTISIYKQNHPEWLFVKHENLSRDPVNQFRKIYETFGLQFTDKAKARILESSGAHNPVEQHDKNEFVRDSEKNIYNWKNRLTKDEIELIRNKTSEISSLFYSENEW